jgi:hypothetical protein
MSITDNTFKKEDIGERKGTAERKSC